MDPALQLIELKECSRRSYENLLRRSEEDITKILPKVRKILSDVRERGDRAVIEFTEKFDGVSLTANELRVREDEIKEAYQSMDENKIEALKVAAERVRKYHRQQMLEDWMDEFGSGMYAGQIIRPLDSVGVYVPGGAAQYPSSVLMSAIPAKVAGVERIIVCTPPNPEGKVNSGTLIAAELADVDEVYRVGGAQAIGAMAYGTRIVPAVEKIVGPGNIYVVAAKQIASRDVDIDFDAGPSEVLIIADSTSDPKQVAIDLIAQAEHGSSSAAVLVTTSKKLGVKVRELIQDLLKEVTRGKVAENALKKYGKVIITRSLKEAIEFSNDYAPEHLQLMVKHPEKILNEIKNAGAIFIGAYTPVAAGDLAIGPSHVLPTGGTARFRSGLSVLSFLRLISVQKLTKTGLESLSEVVERLAGLEELEAHARSVRERFK